MSTAQDCLIVSFYFEVANMTFDIGLDYGLRCRFVSFMLSLSDACPHTNL